MKSPDDNPASTPSSPPNPLLRPQPWRLLLLIGLIGCLFLLIAGRLLQLGLEHHRDNRIKASARAQQAVSRPELQDRNGRVVALDVPTSSLYADPKHLITVDETAEKLSKALPELEAAGLRAKLTTRRRFVWLKRHLTPDERQRVHDLGLPGLYFIDEPQRFYPLGKELAHVIGFVDKDNQGLQAIEKTLDARFITSSASKPEKSRANTGEPVRLSIDIRVQHAVAAELARAIETYRAKAGAAMVLDVTSGEVLALSSQPSFDPQQGGEALQDKYRDRARRSVYELGSVLKCFTVAMGLDEGNLGIEDRFNVAKPIKLGKYVIEDHHKTADGTMSVEEIFIKSSNVGAARIARKVGLDRHRAFLFRLGLLQRLKTDAGAAAAPYKPPGWDLPTSLSASYGYALSLAPLHLAASSLALFNGGYRVQPTFFKKQDRGDTPVRIVLKSGTSRQMNKLMRANVVRGTGRLADVSAYRVGGKTGTARKLKKGKYSPDLRTSFLGVFPTESPRYLTYVMLDEPQKVKASRMGNSASVNAAPTTGRIITRIAPFLSVKPAPVSDN